ncbi:hypothetical protein DPMN_082628 [Dreissena polymorpha]|uniref:Reverse transcriptase n=1 Tax=Dreissena polymorpha TaxID=45954 RepID=A0A9D3Y8F9_DREPO|nr:hypothetical protein DPMN_082628 [Dreissena polymorpha]
MLELNQQRDINQLKYRARTASMGSNLPINESVTEDPAYFKTKHKKRFGLPYAQKVRTLGSYYKTDKIITQAPTYYSLSSLSRPDIDLQLTTLIKKSDNDPANGSIAQTHITNNYSNYIQIYTDGSKNDEHKLAGAAYGLPSNLLHSARELIAIINQKAYNEQDHRWSIYCADHDFTLFNNPSHKINIYSPIKREDRAYRRLRLRVSRLHGDYYKPVNCPQCNIPNTFEHLFFVCPA